MLKGAFSTFKQIYSVAVVGSDINSSLSFASTVWIFIGAKPVAISISPVSNAANLLVSSGIDLIINFWIFGAPSK